MSAPQNLEARLRQLQSSGALSRSQCGASFLTFIEPLLSSEVISEERAGAGRRLVVRDAHTLQIFIDQQFPNTPTLADALSRTTGIARFRDSKALSNDTPEIVHIRASRKGAITRNGSSLSGCYARRR